MPLSQTKLTLTGTFAQYVGIIMNMEQFKEGIDAIISFKNEIPAFYEITPIINNMLKGVIGAKESAKKQGEATTELLNKQIEYVKSQITD